MKKILRIATRKTPLALWQTQYVKNALLSIDPTLEIELIGLTTKGDREQTKALNKVGGKSLFVKELQRAILENNADIAVHSIKDMSAQETDHLTLAAICERDDPRDAFISNQWNALNELPQGAIVGTASPRRTALIKSIRSDVSIQLLRGNVGTRLEKLKQGHFDAIILAAAGLKRLNLENQIKEYLDPLIFIPAIGQGAIGVECLSKNTEMIALLKQIHHEKTAHCVNAERMVNRLLGGDCYTPIAAHAVIEKEQIKLHAMVGSLDGKNIIESTMSDVFENALNLGERCADDLLKKGAKTLLNGKNL